MLYLPGANERALEKAKSLPADGLILDLEDAVAPDAKGEARERVAAAVAGGAYGHRELVARVNALDTAWFADDVRAVAPAGPAAVLVPKVGSVDDVRTIEDALEAAGAPEHTRLWAMLETPAAILRAAEITTASTRLTGFVMGTNDLVKELRAQRVPGRAPLLPALAWALLAVRAAGKTVLDGVYNDLDDAEGFEAECRQGRELGFDGKTLIHPRQLEPCNRIFAPSAAEIADAREVIDAWEAAQRAGRGGVVTVNGRMIENLHVEEARRALAQAEAIEAIAVRPPRGADHASR
ncbi:CoA ester lyase [Egicoccus sp. AB-alg6-2]|uniref:HpcH/HpaI aldolase/citrate lyase family protein n=1 Tax=Egicoccus sp. AB-alg6-2 TaxID=3242692 RepID=UPI00359F0308